LKPFYVIVCLFPSRFKTFLAYISSICTRPQISFSKTGRSGYSSDNSKWSLGQVGRGWDFVEQMGVFTRVSCPFSACNLHAYDWRFEPTNLNL